MSTTTTPQAPASAERHRGELPPVRRRAPVAYTAVAAAVLVLFAALGPGGEATFSIATAGDFWQIAPVSLPVTVTCIVLGLVCVGTAALAWRKAYARERIPTWVPAVTGAAFVLAFLVWAVAESSSRTVPFTGLLQGSLFLAVPLTFGAICGLMCERAGVINIAIEGQLLSGAFLAAVAASLAGSAVVGLVFAPIAGLLVAALLAVFTVIYHVNQIIVGVVLNVLVVGVTGFLYSTVLAANASTWNQPPGLTRIAIPLLAEIPVLGPVLFRQTLVVYLMYLTVIAAHIFLFKTRWGLRVRAVGEHPRAADTVGIKVNATRFRNVLLGGAIAGLGGAFFTVGAGLAFGREMTAGKGFIALAAMIFGRWSPKGAIGAALLFGFAEQMRLTLGIAGTGIPTEFMLMVPYLVTILAVAGLVGRVRPPAADGVPYIK